MKPKNIKSLSIKEDTHQQIDIESAKTRKPMYALIAEAWDAYCREKHKPVPTSADSEVMERFLKFWHEAEGEEVHIRFLVARILGVSEPRSLAKT